MKFTIDRRFIAIQTLKALAAYLIGAFVVLLLIKPKDPEGFIGASLTAGVIIYFIRIFPRKIYVQEGGISFVKVNGYRRSEVRLSEIEKVETANGWFNTLTIETKSGIMYRLHPRDMQDLENLIVQDN